MSLGLAAMMEPEAMAEADTAPARGGYGALHDFWDGDNPIGFLDAAGLPITASTARYVPTVQACLDHLVRPVATLPLMPYARGADGAKQAMDGHPLARVLRDAPNADQDAVAFLSALLDDLVTEGNALALRVDDARGQVVELVPVPWADVERVERDREGRRWYAIRHPWTGERRTYEGGEVWHVALAPFARRGLVGRSRIDMGRHQIGEAMALTLYGAAYFRNVGRGGFLEGPWKDYASAQQWVAAIAKARSGFNRGRTVALPTGAKYAADTGSNGDAQYLELRKELKIEICQLWSMPPHKVGILDRATFSNIEHQSLEYVTDALRPLLVTIERSLKRWLIAPGDPLRLEFNVSALLRGDVAARFAAYAQARQWGWLSVNEIRALETLDPIGTAGDRYMEPANMQPIGGTAPAAVAWAPNARGLWVPSHA